MKNILIKYKLTDSIFFKYLGVLITLISLWFVLNLLLENINNLSLFFTSEHMFLAFLCGLALYAISQINAVFSWFVLLRDKYPKVPFKIQYYIISASQITKYLPGNFAHLLGRIYLSKKYNIKVLDVSKYILIESVLLIYVSILLGVGYFVYFENNFLNLGIDQDWLLILCVATLLIFPMLFFNSFKITNLINISCLYVIGLNVLSFFALGMVLYVFQQLIADTDVSLIKYVVAISIAFAAGFLVPGAPAGIGVREYVFIVLLSQDLSSATALNLIMALRVVNVLGDLIMYLSSYWIKKQSL